MTKALKYGSLEHQRGAAEAARAHRQALAEAERQAAAAAKPSVIEPPAPRRSRDLVRDNWGEAACNEPQPFNWKHACQRPLGHRGEHRVNQGHEDLSWTGDGPIEIIPAKGARAYIGGLR